MPLPLPPPAIGPNTHSIKRRPAVGAVPAGNGTPPGGKLCGTGWAPAGHRPRCQAARPARTKVATALATLSWPAPGTTPGGSAIVRIPGWAPRSQRSPEANDRRTPSYWEVDLMRFGNHGPVLLLRHERHSRRLSPWPAELRLSVVFDNGTEFARHYRLHPPGILTYFCDVRSPGQKGGVENSIGRRRRFLPRWTDLKQLRASELTAVLQAYNNTPRRCWLPARQSIRRCVALEM